MPTVPEIWVTLHSLFQKDSNKATTVLTKQKLTQLTKTKYLIVGNINE